MSSRCCCNSVKTKQNPSGLQRGSNNAFMNHTFSSSRKVNAKAETHSAGNHVNKNGDRTRAMKAKAKEKIQEFDKDSPKLVLSGIAGQDSHSKGENTSKEAKKYADSVKKNEDQTRASTRQKVLNKGKEKMITQKPLKTKQQAEKVAPRPSPKNQSNEPSRKEAPTPIYHIRWDGFEESEEEPLGQRCCLCDVDLAYDPIEEEAEDDYEEDEECDYEYEGFPRLLPEVAVLACGHAFHEQCLLFATPEELSRDPPCIICASLY